MDADRTLTLPLDVVINSNGLSIDAGSSLFKLLYLSKNDWQEIEKAATKPKTATMRLKSFPLTEVDKLIDFIKRECAILCKMDKSMIINSCGITASQVGGRKIPDELGFSMETYCELDCFIYAFTYLTKTIPRKEMCLPLSAAAAKKRKLKEDYMVIFKQTLASEGQIILPEEEQPCDDAPVIDEGLPLGTDTTIFPCLFTMCGSGGAVIQVDKDGSFVMLDIVDRAGRTFLGLSSLLSGGKNYSEVMQLIKEGDEHTVDYFTSDFKVSQDTDDAYSELVNKATLDEAVYSMAKAVDKKIDDFAPGDLCRSLLRCICKSLIETTQTTAMCQGIKHAFFCGSFVADPVIREMFESVLASSIPMLQSLQGHKANLSYHFLRHGTHYGALGAALIHTDQFLRRPSEIIAEIKAATDTAETEKENSEKTNTEKVNA